MYVSAWNLGSMVTEITTYVEYDSFYEYVRYVSIKFSVYFLQTQMHMRIFIHN